MGNRKLPFGYRMQFGNITIHPEECACVHIIFERYQGGASFLDLVGLMQEQGVPYVEGKRWNKNMIARILKDDRYTGQEPYQAIIAKERFDIVATMQTEKQANITKNEARKVLRKICSAKVTPNIEQQVLHLMNELIMHPEQVQYQVRSAQRLVESVEVQRRLERVLEQQPIEEEMARKLICQLASAEYYAIDSCEYETERIKREFLAAKPAEKLNEVLLQKCLSRILKVDRKVNLELKNGQIIEGGVAYERNDT